ncbi:hypothetical protein ABZT34_34465 [Streptomyces sp. NPDC005329]|uniref:hypothetical protein n=1 Tax=Streptomyces sp. NPDC005329 TaxID=3157034 RepID=UPI0033B97C07
MILDLIVSKNMARRQLNAGQRALMALEYERHYAAAQPKGAPVGNRNASQQLPDSSQSADTTRADLRTAGEWVEPQARRLWQICHRRMSGSSRRSPSIRRCLEVLADECKMRAMRPV